MVHAKQIMKSHTTIFQVVFDPALGLLESVTKPRHDASIERTKLPAACFWVLEAHPEYHHRHSRGLIFMEPGLSFSPYDRAET